MTPKVRGASPQDEIQRSVEARITTKRLEDCLKIRQAKHGKVYTLDLRHRDFCGLRAMTLRCPDDPGWPSSGRTTGEKSEAERWVRRSYVEYVRQSVVERRRAAGAMVRTNRRTPGVTVDEACARFLAALAMEKGDEKSFANIRATINRHLVGRFPSLPIAALKREEVEAWLKTLQVRPRGNPLGELVDASLNTKRGVRYCLRSVWRHVMGGATTPFDGMELSDPKRRKAYRKAILEGRTELIFRPRSAYRPAEVSKILTAAMWYDHEKIAARRTTSAIAVPNTAAGIALLVGTGMRVDEMTLLRWKCIDEELGTIRVLGTKTANAPRAIPMQDQVRPWIGELRRLAAPPGASSDWRPDPDAFVFITHPSDPKARASTRSIIYRFSEVLEWAALKRPGKATHWARSTHATWARQPPRILGYEDLQRYLGHAAQKDEETTEGYIEIIEEMIPDEHRRYIRTLPDPTSVRELVASFEPAERPGWRDRRRNWTPRDKASREQRRQARDGARSEGESER